MLTLKIGVLLLMMLKIRLLVKFGEKYLYRFVLLLITHIQEWRIGRVLVKGSKSAGSRPASVILWAWRINVKLRFCSLFGTLCIIYAKRLQHKLMGHRELHLWFTLYRT